MCGPLPRSHSSCQGRTAAPGALSAASPARLRQLYTPPGLPPPLSLLPSFSASLSFALSSSLSESLEEAALRGLGTKGSGRPPGIRRLVRRPVAGRCRAGSVAAGCQSWGSQPCLHHQAVSALSHRRTLPGGTDSSQRPICSVGKSPLTSQGGGREETTRTVRMADVSLQAVSGGCFWWMSPQEAGRGPPVSRAFSTPPEPSKDHPQS